MLKTKITKAKNCIQTITNVRGNYIILYLNYLICVLFIKNNIDVYVLKKFKL